MPLVFGTLGPAPCLRKSSGNAECKAPLLPAPPPGAAAHVPEAPAPVCALRPAVGLVRFFERAGKSSPPLGPSWDEDLEVVHRDPGDARRPLAHAQSRPSAPPAWMLGPCPQSHPITSRGCPGTRRASPTAAAREVLTNLMAKDMAERLCSTFPSFYLPVGE